MKKQLIFLIIVFVFITNSLFSKDKLGQYNIWVNLKNNESIIIDTTIDRILNQNRLKIDEESLNSIIINSFDSENINSSIFINYINNVIENRNIGYSGISPNNYETLPYDGYIGGKKSNRISKFGYYVKSGLGDNFSNYYHDLFKNIHTRKILVDRCTEFLVSVCNKYPKDFNDNLIFELNSLLKFSHELDSLNEIDTDRLRSYWEGFIYRRNKIDNIPVNEIQETIKNLTAKISQIESNDLPEALISFNINNSIIVLYRSDHFEIMSSNGLRIKLNPKVEITSIKYLEDKSGSFFQIEGKKNNVLCKYLFSTELNEIMNTEDQANSIYFTSSGGEKILEYPNLNSQVSYTMVSGDAVAIISESKENHFFFKVKTKNNNVGYLEKNRFREEVIFEFSSEEYNRLFHRYLIENKISRNK